MNEMKSHLPLTIVSFFLGFGMTFGLMAQAEEFTGTLTAISENGFTIPLTFKTVTGATDGYEDGIDIPAAPPMNPPVLLDIAFPATGWFTRLFTDARAPADSISWTVHLRADEDGGTLTWDVSSIPPTYDLSLIWPSQSTQIITNMDQTTTLIMVQDGSIFDVGNTLVIGQESLTILAITANDLTVVRGVNNTSSGTHNIGSTITSTQSIDMRTQNSVNYIANDSVTQIYTITAQKVDDAEPLNPAPSVWNWSKSELSAGDSIEINFGWASDGEAPAAGLQVQLLTDLSEAPLMQAVADGNTEAFNFTLTSDLGAVRLYARAVDPESGQATTEIGSVDPPPQITLYQNDNNETIDPDDVVTLSFSIPPPKGAQVVLSVGDDSNGGFNKVVKVDVDSSPTDYSFTLSTMDFEGLDSPVWLGGWGEGIEEFGTNWGILFDGMRANWHTPGSEIGPVPPLPEVNILDSSLRAALENVLGKNEGEAISQDELATLTDLKAGYWGQDQGEITDLTGIEYCVNLEFISLNGQSSISAEQLSVLVDLPKLTGLNWGNNTQINNLSALENLTGLQDLYLTHNNGQGQINDISALQSLPNLQTLHLFGHQVEDISVLTSLPNLTDLSIGGNPFQLEHAMAVIPTLTNLTHLSTSYLDWTDDDLSLLLANLTSLVSFHHHHNDSGDGSISHLSAFADLVNLQNLTLEGQSISQIPDLSTWTSLTRLNLERNPLTQDSFAAIQDLLLAGVEVRFDSSIPIGDWQILPSGNIEQGPGSYYLDDSSMTQTFEHIWEPSQAWVKVLQLAQEDSNNPPVLWQIIDGKLWVHRQKFLSQDLDDDTGKSLSNPSLFHILDGETPSGWPVYYYWDGRWSIPFRLQSTQSEQDVVNLIAGVSSEASDGYDEDLDVLVPNSPPSPVALHAYWLNEDDPSHPQATKLSHSYRSSADSLIFSLEVWAEQDAFTLHWDLTQLPDSYTSLSLRQIQPADGSQVSLNMRHQIGQAVTLQGLEGESYRFEVELSSQYQLAVAAGWNLISLPGRSPSLTGQQSLEQFLGQSSTAMSPMFIWNPEGFSYQKVGVGEEVSEFQLGQGYWLLDLAPEGEVLQLGLGLEHSYSVDLKAGWNMIGSVAGVHDFSDPQDQPDGSIARNSLYEWKVDGQSYRAASQIEEGKGYWVLCWEPCQLQLGGPAGLEAAPSLRVTEESRRQPQGLIALQLTSGQQQELLEIGWAENGQGMDYPRPPQWPKEGGLEAYLQGEKYQWQRQIRSSGVSKEWQLRLSSGQAVGLRVSSEQSLGQQELVLKEGEQELVLRLGQEIELSAGERQIELWLRAIRPKESRVLQNYPNPFNPETWIPYQLHQPAEVSLRIYDHQGKRVRQIELGQKEAGIYNSRQQSIYWDGRNGEGELVSSGVYFYSLQAGDFSQTRKMVILK